LRENAGKRVPEITTGRKSGERTGELAEIRELRVWQTRVSHIGARRNFRANLRIQRIGREFP
jgi:hypothetical protein